MQTKLKHISYRDFFIFASFRRAACVVLDFITEKFLIFQQVDRGILVGVNALVKAGAFRYLREALAVKNQEY